MLVLCTSVGKRGIGRHAESDHAEPFTVPLSDGMLARLHGGPTPEEVLISRTDQFREAMKDLPEREAVFLGLWYGGTMQAEIAAQYGVTQQAVSFAIKRATARLRWMLAGIAPKGRGFRRGRPRGRASGVMGEVAWAVVRGGR